MSSPAYEMTGPSALAGGWRRFWVLSRTLALTDFKLRFFGSLLGYVWSLLRPLMMFGILYVVFSQIVDVSGGIRFYGVMLLTGVVLHFYFAETTGNALTSLIDRETLVRKIHFPRAAVPFSVALTASINLALNLVVLFGFALAAGVPVRWTWLALPLVLAVLIVFAVGAALLLSALFVRLRDLRPIWEVVLQALFYATPVIWPIEQLAEDHPTAANIVMCNPLAALIQEARHLVVDPSAPSAAAAIGGTGRLAIPAAIIVATCIAGWLVFERAAPQLADEL